MVRIESTEPSDRRLTIIGGERELVARWMLEKLPEVTELPGGYEAIGIARGGQLIGGCLYTDYRPCRGGGNVHIWGAGEVGWMTRRTIRVVLGYPFEQLKCHRLTATAAKGNRKSRRLLEGLGFQIEGKIRRGFDTRQDMIVYGMLREECGWV